MGNAKNRALKLAARQHQRSKRSAGVVRRIGRDVDGEFEQRIKAALDRIDHENAIDMQMIDLSYGKDWTAIASIVEREGRVVIVADDVALSPESMRSLMRGIEDVQAGRVHVLDMRTLALDDEPLVAVEEAPLLLLDLHKKEDA